MPKFRLPRGRSRRDTPASLEGLTDRQLLDRSREIDRAFDADDDPDGRAAELDRLAEEILRHHPGSEPFWYDRGMYAKWRRDWTASREYNVTAFALLPQDKREQDPTAWNLGIAATALRDWTLARQAWTAFGLTLAQPAAPDAAIDEDFGLAPVRLNPHPRFAGQQPLAIDGQSGDTEVVWGRRLCPARIRIDSIPTPGTGHRYGDVVLHDGDPVGTRRLGDRDVSVFNEIELWQRSPHPTLTAVLTAPAQQDVADLEHLLDEAGWAAEDWTANLQVLCRCCSEGTPDPATHQDSSATWNPERSIGLAGDPGQIQELLREWASSTPGRAFTALEIALPAR